MTIIKVEILATNRRKITRHQTTQRLFRSHLKYYANRVNLIIDLKSLLEIIVGK